MPTLYIIDGYAQFFRNYHAIRTPMSSPVTKEPTNMTFGFVGALLKLLRGQGNLGGPPDYVMVALDVSGDRGTFRSQLYPDYKAQRPPPPEDLRPQVDRCLAMLKELGVPIFGAEGFEADDVIATLVTRLRDKYPDLRIRIVSKDKDLKQLLSRAAGGNGNGTPTVREGPVPSPAAGSAMSSPSPSPALFSCVELFDLHTDQAFTVETLAQETGITPPQVIDMLALMGDTVDNVPGVPGVGEKTAAQLIKEYGSLDNLLARAAEIKGKRGESLRAAAPALPLSRKLVTLRLDTPVPEEAFDLTRASAKSFHLEKLGPILKELGFNRYQEELRVLLGAAAPGGGGAMAPTGTPAPPRPEPARGPIGGLFEHLDQQAGRARAVPRGEYTCIRTGEELSALVRRLRAAPAIAIDTETTCLAPTDANLCGISLSIGPGAAVYIPVRSPTPAEHLDEKTVLEALRPILEDESKPKLGHNLKYDLLVLRRAGVELRGLSTPGSCDSMIASYLIDSSRSSHSLEALSLALLKNGKTSITELIGSGKQQRSFETVPVEDATCYAAMDADLSLQLAQVMLPELRAMGLMDLFEKLEMPLVEVLAELEWNGILVDPDELDRQRDRLSGRIKELLGQIQDRAMETIGRTFDPDSPKQLAAALFNKPADQEPGLGIKPLRKTKTGYSTDAEVLEKLAADPDLPTTLPKLILEYRQLTKLVSTYLVALKEAINPRTHRVHASFNQTVAATGRLSASDPNLQNIPIRTEIGRDIRKAFIAPPGCVLISADYSQIELRLLAHLSRDPALNEAFHKGEDIHTAVAAQIHGIPVEQVSRDQRAGAKMVNFGIVYGITPYGLSRRLGISDKEAGTIIDGYKRKFAGISMFLEECIAQAKRYGYVETMMKRRRPITDINSSNPSMRALAERMAINSVVQGSAADLIKLAMVDIHGRLKDPGGMNLGGMNPERKRGAAVADENGARSGPAPVRMLLQIHDELVFESPEPLAQDAKALIVERMESAMQLSVPLRADASIGKNWFEGK